MVATRPLIESTHRLLAATAGRAANFGCFGMHEWAMVHGSDEVRHPAHPLRLGAAGTDAVVESQRIACSHFDAFRFFTASARPLNTLNPAPHDRPAFEQPGCLHAGMDLYKERLPPVAADRIGAGRRLLRAGPRHPGPRHARLAVRPVRRWATRPVPRRDRRRQGRSTSPRSAPSPSAAPPLRARLIEECERLLRDVVG